MEDIKAVLLVGGLGKRLRPVLPSVPKPLASVGGTSFLQLLIGQLRSQGIRRVVMCTGYMGATIQNEFGDGRAWDVEIEYSNELTPLGTAGALKLAESHLAGESHFLVMNGDSFVEVDFSHLIGFHLERRGFASLVVGQVQNASRFGTVQLDSRSRVTGFLEKTGCIGPGKINAGVYIFNQDLFEHIPEGPCSLEREVFPQVLDRGIYAVEQQGLFIDIGTPEDYARAQQLCEELHEKAFHASPAMGKR